MWTGDDYLEHLYERAGEQRDGSAAGETPEQRKARLIRSLRDSLGEFEIADTVAASTLETVRCDGYTRTRVELSVIPGLAFGAYILKPDSASGKRPGIIAVHGHGYGSRQICGMLEDGTNDTGNRIYITILPSSWSRRVLSSLRRMSSDSVNA